MDEMDTIRKEIRENVDDESLLADKPEDENLIDGYVELMMETCCFAGIPCAFAKRSVCGNHTPPLPDTGAASH